MYIVLSVILYMKYLTISALSCVPIAFSIFFAIMFLGDQSALLEYGVRKT